MGTRADFYVGVGENAEWLGSIAFDGYPEGAPDSVSLLESESEADFRSRVESLLQLDHATRPEHGWPWPWSNSGTTDCAYAWCGKVKSFSWAQEHTGGMDEDGFPVTANEETVFPEMSTVTARAPGTLGSGIMVISR